VVLGRSSCSRDGLLKRLSGFHYLLLEYLCLETEGNKFEELVSFVCHAAKWVLSQRRLCRKKKRLSEAHADDPILSKRLTILDGQAVPLHGLSNFPKRPRF